MGILNIKPVKRGGSKALLAISGPTGSGKTLTALLIARGMVDKPSEIGFLDTEHKRGSFYADKLDGAFMIGDLFPPFSPSRYREAIKEFQEHGVKVLVVDSGSHEWEGEGGCEDIANAPLNAGKKMADWVRAKREHKAFMNTLLHSDMHIIICLRAREKTDFKDPAKPISLGIQPICEKNFMFEMMASIFVENEGKSQKHIKVPNFLKDAFGTGEGYLGIETGRKIIDWINKGEREDPEVAKIKSEMLMACEMGLAGVTAIWNSLTPTMKKKLQEHKDLCKEAALEYEKQAKEANETPQESLSDRMKAGETNAKETVNNLP